MTTRKWYEWMLTVAYIAMLGLFVFLNFTPGHKESLANIIVNGIMFIIVGIIFLIADTKCFGPMNAIIADLNQASDTIRRDAMNTHSYLWEPYNSSKTEIFRTEKMTEVFRDFLFDINRDEDAANSYYKTNIDEYINDDIVDVTMHRNELNQVAGMLTGLGILGTFIGLSLGLQSFNTGTTAQMTESIEPLMNGIKVAFHTSIYGMVFSLVFNTIYKKKLYDAENAVEHFIVSFKRYVLPDTSNDGMNQLILLQEEQINALNELAETITDELADIITPHLESLHETIVDFENMATRNQTEAMGQVVECFIAEMNSSLNNTFDNLGASINDIYETQQANAALMKQVIDTITRSTGNISDVNRETERLAITLNKYSEGIQKVLDELKRTIDALATQDNGSLKLLQDEQRMLTEQHNLLSGFTGSISDISKFSEKSHEEISNALIEMTDALYFIKKSMDKTQAQPTKPTRR